MSQKVKIFALLFSFFAFSEAQVFPTCNPLVVEWFPHPHDCESYIICFHGVQHVMPCAPGLHFSPTELRCTFPQEAQCHVNYLCPEEDDEQNPVFLPDPIDCGVYYVCSRGSPIRRECAPGLWWDIELRWCNIWDEVVCDNRTIINPPNPGNRTTLAPTTTIPTTTTTTIPTTTTSSISTTTLRPGIESCHMRRDLFDGDTYLKSMCILNANVNYATARQRCASINMNLFIIDNSRVQTPFFNATTDLLRAHTGGFVWINGQRQSGQWNVFNADNTVRGPLYSGVDWVNTSSIHGPTNGDCLRYSSQFGPYQAVGVACTTTSWIVCEHGMQSDLPTTTAPPLTTTTEDPLSPNVTVCWRRADLFHNGSYLKSQCIINTSLNYTEGDDTCRRNGMQLFVIDSAQTQAQFRNTTGQLLIAQPRGFVWINGRVDDSCGNWFTFNPQRNPLFSGVQWVQTDDFNGRTSGPCLRYSQQRTEQYFAMGEACSSRSWIICEFSLPPAQDVSDFWF